MVSHIIVFTVLSILSVIAIHAVGKPISKSSPAQKAAGSEESPTPAPQASL